MQSNIVQWVPGMTLEATEKQVILAAFRHFRGNKTQTAISLGIAVRTLDNKLAEYKVTETQVERNKADDEKRRNEFLDRQRGFKTDSGGGLLPIVEQRTIAEENEHTKRIREAKERKLQSQTRGNEKHSSNGSHAEAGLHMEPVERNSTQQPVPLPLGKEIQSMPSKHAAGNRNGKRR